MITFPRSRIIEFYKERNKNIETHKHLRVGQDFYTFFELEKVTDPADKAVCEKIWSCPTTEANWIIIKHTDWEN